MLKRSLLTLCFTLNLIGFIPFAHAHKVVTTFWVSDEKIVGEIGFSNGQLAQEGIEIEIVDENDQKLDQISILSNGLFEFTPTKSITYFLKSNLGAGHVAFIEIPREELPPPLSQLDEGSEQPSLKTSTNAPSPVQIGTNENVDLRQLIKEAVRIEVQPLRKEIASYKEKNDLQTILGGIGYILGLTGLWFFFEARRKKKE